MINNQYKFAHIYKIIYAIHSVRRYLADRSILFSQKPNILMEFPKNKKLYLELLKTDLETFWETTWKYVHFTRNIIVYEKYTKLMIFNLTDADQTKNWKNCSKKFQRGVKMGKLMTRQYKLTLKNWKNRHSIHLRRL